MGSGRADMWSVGRGCWSSLKYKDYLISISSYRMSTAFGSWSPVSSVINLIFIEEELSATKQIPRESLSIGNWNWHWSKILPNSHSQLMDWPYISCEAQPDLPSPNVSPVLFCISSYQMSVLMLGGPRLVC